MLTLFILAASLLNFKTKQINQQPTRLQSQALTSKPFRICIRQSAGLCIDDLDDSTLLGGPDFYTQFKHSIDFPIFQQSA